MLEILLIATLLKLQYFIHSVILVIVKTFT